MPSQNTPKSKKCSKCQTVKPLEDFPTCITGSYGRYNYCRECHSAYQKKLHPDRVELDEKAARTTGLRKLGLKTCTSCREVKPLDDFYLDPRRADGRQAICKECWAVKSENKYYQREYGLSPEDYTRLLDAQNGVCAICGRTPKKWRFNVDHCHKTHVIRALLCVNCNTNLLPYVERFPEWIKKAFEYLENPPAFSVLGRKTVPETNQARRKDDPFK